MWHIHFGRERCKYQGSNGVSCNKKRVKGCYVKIQEREGGVEWKVVICQSKGIIVREVWT